MIKTLLIKNSTPMPPSLLATPLYLHHHVLIGISKSMCGFVECFFDHLCSNGDRPLDRTKILYLVIYL